MRIRLKSFSLWWFAICGLTLIETAHAVHPVAHLPVGVKEVVLYPAPPLIVVNDAGGKVDLTAARGHWAFVHFWAAWCVPCRREMPNIAQLQKRMQGQDIQFFIVNTADSEDAVFEFLGSVAADLTSLRDPDGSYTEGWRPRGLPSTFLVDPQGMVHYRALGGRKWNEAAYLDFLAELIAHSAKHH
ncbi:MAG: TlpA family protein disulfide reductase [Gammaproteobacteria bacterium]|nr:TlpA family protein disulfide reductase [Gammaproteobacteria bacterium]